MKQILIVVASFRHGGISKSLENLLSLIDAEKYRIDVFAMDHYGPYKTMLINCTILKKNKWLESLSARYSDTKGVARMRSFFIKILRNLCSYIRFDITDFIFKFAMKRISKDKKYDTVIAYSEGAPTRFVSFFNVHNKIAWIHCEYSNYLKIINNVDETKTYDKYKSIICVSDYTKKDFCRIMPSMYSRTYSIHNVLNTSLIFELSKEKIIDEHFVKKNFTIISIGRNDWVKRVYIIPQIARALKDKGCEFKWYLIGPQGLTDDHKKLESNIIHYEVSDCFCWLDTKDNPYPYLAQSDLLVNVSISEACPFVINEAKVLHIPVVCTDFDSAIEFIEDGINGFIAPIEQITDKIYILIKNKEEYNRIKENIYSFIYDNEKMLKDIYALL
ncbi:MAG: glycosyltransferase [Dysgonamonadaceae bacterium]|jgi:glycosyltransferase involved in cell wall biosynthesis|nr:glycosyltransferase [Dysgonamonadaceae bacterium]